MENGYLIAGTLSIHNALIKHSTAMDVSRIERETGVKKTSITTTRATRAVTSGNTGRRHTRVKPTMSTSPVTVQSGQSRSVNRTDCTSKHNANDSELKKSVNLIFL